MKTILIAILLCLILSLPALAVYRVGDTVADFTLRDWQGNWVSLYNDYPNKIVLSLFWTPG